MSMFIGDGFGLSELFTAALLNQCKALNISNTLVVSAGQATSDAQTACGLSDALVCVSSHGSSGSTSSSPKKLADFGQASWEQLLRSFLEWVDVEALAMKCENPIQAQDTDELHQCVHKQLAFNRIIDQWESNCSCGERRTPNPARQVYEN